jgi:hypothetical protein
LWAYYVKNVYFFYSHRADKALDAANAGLAINPNFGLGGEASPIFFPAVSNKPKPIHCKGCG